MMKKTTKAAIVLLFFVLLATLPARKILAVEAGDVNFTFQDQTFTAKPADVQAWRGWQLLSPSNILNPPVPTPNASMLKFIGQAAPEPGGLRFYHYKLSAIYNYLQGLASQIDRPTVEPALTIQNNLATDFKPPQDGLSLDVYKGAFDALAMLELGKTGLELTVYNTSPQTQLSQTNTLGINELIASGVSNFKGSPKNRRFNIAAGVEKFKGVIVPQGQEFSFDDSLGPVDGEHGFLPELVIKGNNTLPEFGGGLCQVSTTTFRAAMAAGVPITARRNHAYAVQYYSPQGTDATIYPGSADLKFINDTPGAILIWPYIKDTNTLVFDFYGSDDGRQVTLEKPVVYDRQTSGAMKATWTRLVTQYGQTRTDVFKSVYQPPALFHHDSQFVSSTGQTTQSQPAGLQMPPKTQ